MEKPKTLAMDAGDKLYVNNLFEKIEGGQIVNVDFYVNDETKAEVPGLIVEMPDGRNIMVLVYRDDMEDAPGWLELSASWHG